MSDWAISIIFGVGFAMVTTSAIHFFWEGIKMKKQRAKILARIEKLHKVCTS